jgi:WG containing repeat
MRTAIAAAFLLLALPATPSAQDVPEHRRKPTTSSGNSSPNNRADVASAGATGTPCVFDFERGEVPNCVRERPTGELFIAGRVLKELQFDSYGLAALLSPKRGWMYVGRTGRVVVSGVPSMDNSADSFHDGLVRTVTNEKYGFANRKGQLVIPAVYDGAMSFQDGRATVCKGCTSTCVERECEHHLFKGGEWFQIDAKGTILARLHPNR